MSHAIIIIIDPDSDAPDQSIQRTGSYAIMLHSIADRIAAGEDIRVIVADDLIANKHHDKD